MRNFDYESAASFEEASTLLKNTESGKAVAIAGGTDLVGVMKEKILKKAPEKVVNLKTIQEGNYIKEEGNAIEIGALTKLTQIVESPELTEGAAAVQEAAKSIASPIIRNEGTIGGNLCQDVRCWFYRYPNGVGGRLDCARKGGEECFAIQGQNRYHSIYGGMKTGFTPCSHECPGNTDIPGYMAKLREGDWDGAARIFLEYNPMPMVTSRVCPHNCQLKCNQNQHGDPVDIHAVERSLGDYIIAHYDDYFKAPEQESGKKVAIVGAGPGGLTAAYYLRRAGEKVVVYDRMEKAGGVLQYGIPHYRLPKDIVDGYAAQLEKMGVEFRMNTEIGKDITLDQLDQEYDAIYLGTGAWKQPLLGIGGEELTQFGLNFLVDVNTYLQKAIGNDILVCGGGNVAMDVAMTAKRLGAKSVKLVCLEQADEMPATEEDVSRAKEEGVEIFNGWGLSRVLTDADGKVNGLESMKCTSVRNAEGRFDPQYDYDTKMNFASDYIILATGQRVDISFLGENFLSQVKSPRGLIDADLETAKTSNPKIYAGGDAVTGPNLAIKAIHGGRVAAITINKDLGVEEYHWPQTKGFLHFDKDAIKKTTMHVLPERTVSERTLSDEDTGSFTPETAIQEAGRCMDCGCYSVNASDLSPVMVMMDAELITTEKTIRSKDFFTTKLKAYDMLNPGELIKAVRFEKLDGYTTGYDKFRVRDSIDFAIASLAYAYKLEDGVIRDVKLVLGAVAPVPLVRPEVEAFLIGKKPTKEVAAEAAEIAVKDAAPLQYNAYKVQEVRALISNLVERMANA